MNHQGNETIQAGLCIVGAGAGGLSLAAVAAQLGIKVVLVERHKMGGDCLNTGCVPSKALLAAAKHAWATVHQSKFGCTVEKASINFSQVMAHVHGAIAEISPHDSVERFEGLGCRVILGHGRFIDPHQLAVDDKYVIKARQFVIATGSSPMCPPIEGLKNINYFTNETIFNLQRLPKHLVIIGAGVIGCELGQAFAMLGAKVTLIARSTILPKEDPQAVALIRDAFKQLHIRLVENTQVQSVAELAERVAVVVNSANGEEIITGSHILVATGRKPNCEGLDLAKADIELVDNAIKVDMRLRTSQKHICAIGDVIAQQQFTHVANYHAGILIKNLLFRLPAKVQTYFIPKVIYTSPEIAHVGLTQLDAEQQSIMVVVKTLSYQQNDRAVAEGMTDGFVKIIADRKNRVLGVTIVGGQAGELINIWGIAVRKKMSLKQLTDNIVAYPTLSELNKRAAGLFYQDALFSNKTKKLVRWLTKC